MYATWVYTCTSFKIYIHVCMLQQALLFHILHWKLGFINTHVGRQVFSSILCEQSVLYEYEMWFASTAAWCVTVFREEPHHTVGHGVIQVLHARAPLRQPWTKDMWRKVQISPMQTHHKDLTTFQANMKHFSMWRFAVAALVFSMLDQPCLQCPRSLHVCMLGLYAYW